MANLEKRKSTHTIQSVQALRAFAAALVLVGHILLDFTHRYHVSTFNLTQLPWLTGVDVFFCVSGFIMMLTSWDHFGEKGYPGTFALHRIIRIVPTYYIFTTLMVGVVLLAPNMLGATKVEPFQILTSYFFLPYQRLDGAIQPVLPVGWTLNYEFFFYALFAICLLLPRGMGLLLMAVLFGGFATCHRWFENGPTALVFWTDPMIVEFVAGAGIAYLYRQNIRLRRYPVIGVASILLSIVIFFGQDAIVRIIGLQIPRLILSGGPALLLLASCTLLIGDETDKRTPSWLVLLGSSSYALYLSHPFGMRVASVLWSSTFGRLHLSSNVTLMFAPVVFLMCLGLGVLVHLWIEKPLTRFITRKVERYPVDRKVLALQPLGGQQVL